MPGSKVTFLFTLCKKQFFQAFTGGCTLLTGYPSCRVHGTKASGGGLNLSEHCNIITKIPFLRCDMVMSSGERGFALDISLLLHLLVALSLQWRDRI